MSKSLTAIENQRKAEERAAKQWLRRHPDTGELPPKKRLESGEGAYTEQSDYIRDIPVSLRRHHTNAEGQRTAHFTETGGTPEGEGGDAFDERQPSLGVTHAGPGSPVSYSMFGDGEPSVLSPRPIWPARKLTPEQVEVAARLAHVLSFLRPDRATLIRERHLIEGGRTLKDIAAEAGVSRQAVAKRLKLATRDFHVAYEAHYHDAIMWEAE